MLALKCSRRCTRSPTLPFLNSELVLKAERNNAEVRLENVVEYPKVVDAEWNIL